MKVPTQLLKTTPLKRAIQIAAMEMLRDATTTTLTLIWLLRRPYRATVDFMLLILLPAK
jgi:hypothetical protein